MGRPKKIKEEEIKIDKSGSINTLVKELRAKGFNVKFASEIEKTIKFRTDIFPLDYVLDGGISICEGGHRIEFHGPESSGKTSLATKIIAKFQSAGKKCAFMDVEDSFDNGWASVLGVDTEKLVIVKPIHQEQAGDMLVEMIPLFDLIVVDSVASMIPKAELESSLEQKNMALQAQVNSPMVRKLLNAFNNQKTSVIFINQLREKVGIAYGNPIVTPGGRALKHLYNTRVEFRTTEYIEEGTNDKKERIGVVTTMKCIKNKRGKPYRVSCVDFYYDGFIDNRKALLYSAIKFGIVQQAGPYYSYGELKEQGSKNFCDKIDETTWQKIQNEIWERLK